MLQSASHCLVKYNGWVLFTEVEKRHNRGGKKGFATTSERRENVIILATPLDGTEQTFHDDFNWCMKSF